MNNLSFKDSSEFERYHQQLKAIKAYRIIYQQMTTQQDKDDISGVICDAFLEMGKQRERLKVDDRELYVFILELIVADMEY